MTTDPMTTDPTKTEMKTIAFEEFLRPHASRMIRERIPHSVMVEITHRCNFRCVHCYCPPRALRTGELTVDEFGRVFDQLAEAGTLQVVLTGGDPLLRPDFPEIYRAAKERGFLLVVYTNAALVTESIVDLFSAYRPRRVEVTLYGLSEATHDAVTRIKGAHRHVYDNIRRMLDRGLSVTLKSVALTLTAHEIHRMKAFADDLGVDFRFDGRIHPRIDGSFKPLDYRLSPEALVEVETSLPEAEEQLRVQYEQLPAYDSDDGAVFMCGAGVVSATVDPYGRLHLCTTLRKPGFDLLAGQLPESWNGEVRRIRAARRSPAALEAARQEGWVEKCPGFSYLEQGDLETISPFILDVARAEKRAVRDPQSPT